MQFDRHALVLLVRRTDAPELTDEEAAELQDRHLAFRADLRDRGYLIGGGPLVDQDDERLRGISIMRWEIDEIGTHTLALTRDGCLTPAS